MMTLPAACCIYKPVDAYYGPQNALLTILVLTGLDGATGPALQVRAK
jgi:hypothetical protein